MSSSDGEKHEESKTRIKNVKKHKKTPKNTKNHKKHQKTPKNIKTTKKASKNTKKHQNNTTEKKGFQTNCFRAVCKGTAQANTAIV